MFSCETLNDSLPSQKPRGFLCVFFNYCKEATNWPCEPLSHIKEPVTLENLWPAQDFCSLGDPDRLERMFNDWFWTEPQQGKKEVHIQSTEAGTFIDQSLKAAPLLVVALGSHCNYWDKPYVATFQFFCFYLSVSLKLLYIAAIKQVKALHVAS